MNIKSIKVCVVWSNTVVATYQASCLSLRARESGSGTYNHLLKYRAVHTEDVLRSIFEGTYALLERQSVTVLHVSVIMSLLLFITIMWPKSCKHIHSLAVAQVYNICTAHKQQRVMSWDSEYTSYCTVWHFMIVLCDTVSINQHNVKLLYWLLLHKHKWHTIIIQHAVQ